VQYGWVWTPNVGSVPVLPTKEFTRSYAFDINDAGTVVGKGYTGDWSSSTSGKALLWLKGAYSTPIDLEAARATSGCLPGWTLRKPVAVSNPDPLTGAYYVVCYGGYTQNGTSVIQAGAVLKMVGGALDRAHPLQSVAPDAYKPFFNYLNVNNAGQVCGTNSSQSPSLPGTYNCLWNAEDGQLTFSAKSTANIAFINDAGAIVGEMTQSTGGRNAYLSEAPYTKVDFLQTQMSGVDGGAQTIPYGLNNTYQVVGQAVYPSNLARIAAYWKVETDTTTGQPLRDEFGNVVYTYYDLARTYITGTSVVKYFWLAAGINDTGWIVVDAQPTSTTHRAIVLIPYP
jgi:hypothetical protein